MGSTGLRVAARFDVEAEAIARRALVDGRSPRGGVASGAGDTLQCSGADCGFDETIHAANNEHRISHSSVTKAEIAALGPGQQLALQDRGFFEPRFGTDLSQVRVHDGPMADELARKAGAHAFTYRHDVVFAEDQYQPGSRNGRRLLAHELAHIYQQGAGTRSAGAKRGQDTSPSGIIQRQPCSDDASQKRKSEEPAKLIIPATTPSVSLTFQSRRLPDLAFNLDPRLIGISVEDLTLASKTASCIPEGSGSGSLLNQIQTRLQTSRLELDDQGFMRGSGKVILEHDLSCDPLRHSRLYRELFGTTELNFSIETERPIDPQAMLGELTDADPLLRSPWLNGSVNTGPVDLDFRIRLHYHQRRLEEGLASAAAPKGDANELRNQTRELLGRELGTSIGAVRRIMHSLDTESLIVNMALGALTVGGFVDELIAIAKRQGVEVDVTTGQRLISAFVRFLVSAGFSATGTLKVNTGLRGMNQVPVIGQLFDEKGRVTVTKFEASSDSTAPLDLPLLGAIAPCPLRLRAWGIIPTTPQSAGFQTDLPAVPALGFHQSDFGRRSGSLLSIGAIPTLDSEGENLLQTVPIVGFFEFQHSRRVSAGLDLSFRFNANLSTAQLLGGNEGKAGDLGNFRDLKQKELRRDNSTNGAGAKPRRLPLPNIGVSVEGRF